MTTNPEGGATPENVAAPASNRDDISPNGPLFCNYNLVQLSLSKEVFR